ncbi:MAG TPA: glycosyltransferase [Polyangiaceae bacterium]|jgi:glycosyltransferase involved in cell wall biosynthesis|nr:glycosyltransferase [Polyangiaceae bacterium]
MRALVVSYAFPPVGGAGVQRVLKLVKYLPSHGVTASVLTVENPSVPLSDASLEREIPPDVEVVRARTLEPGYRTKELAWKAAASSVPGPMAQLRKRAVGLGKSLLVPDPQILWLPLAGKKLLEHLYSNDDQVVLISGPPFSQFLLTFVARLKPKTAVVLDYRDEWSMTRTVYEMGGAARAGELLEEAVLRASHAVVTATEAFRRELLRRFDFLTPERVTTIPNGYDPDDFPAVMEAPPTDRFVLTYVGTVFKLTSARPLLEAIRRLHAREPDLARLLEVRFIGRIVETEAAAFEGMEERGVIRLGYVEHDRALQALAASHAVLCMLDDNPGAERIYPAKIFELMYLGKPCLTISPEGALATMVREHELGPVLSPKDPDAITSTLIDWLHAFRDRRWRTCDPDVSSAVKPSIQRFHRQRLAGEFASVFERAVSHARAPASHSEPAFFTAK